MNESIISWNFTNWVTIVIMAAVGFMLAALASQLVHSAAGTKKASQ